MNGLLKVICLIAVISLCPGVSSLGSAQAAMPTVTYLETIGAGAELLAPGAIDLDVNGNLYVADARLGIVKYNKYGAVVATFSAQSVSSSGVAVNPAGTRIYVAGKSSGSDNPDQVAILDGFTGALLGYLGQGAGEFGDAGEIDLDGTGRIYVLDRASVSVKAYLDDGAGNAVADGSFTVSDAVAAGDTDGMSGMVVNASSNEVYVSDRQSPAQIRIYSTTGGLVNSYAFATGMGAVAGSPAGIAFDAQGRTYFLDKGNSTIIVADSDGSFPAGNTIASTQLLSPTDASADAYGRLFVSSGSQIAIFGLDNYTLPSNSAPPAPTNLSPLGGSVESSATPQLSFDTVVDPDGDVVTYAVSVSCGGSLVESQAGLTTGAYQVQTTLPENAFCDWSVVANDGDLSSAPASAAFAVNAVAEAPSAPANLLPASPAAVDGLTALQWDDSTDPDPNDMVTYSIQLVQVGGASLGAPAEVQSGVLVNQLPVYASMVPGKKYSWQITATDNSMLTVTSTESFVFAETGLIIDSNVSGADVYLGGNPEYLGEKVGQTPYVQLGAADGDYQVAVVHKGFEPVFGMVTLAAGQPAQFYADMLPAFEIRRHFNKKAGLKAFLNGADRRVYLPDNGQLMPTLADIDDDGKLDLLVGKLGRRLVLLRGLTLDQNLNLRFASRELTTTLLVDGGGEVAPFVADWNNDRLQDLVYGAADGLVRVVLNSGVPGMPVFDGETAVELIANNQPISAGSLSVPFVVDWNGDGAKDLIVGGASGEVKYYENIGTDSAPSLKFTKTLYRALGFKVVPFVSDWDADGDLDLLIGKGGEIVWRNNEAGTLAAAKRIGLWATDRVARQSLQVGSGFVALDLDGRRGKDLIAVDPAGELIFEMSRGNAPGPAFFEVLIQKLDAISVLIANDTNDAQLLAMVEDAKTAANAAGLATLPVKVADLKAAQDLPVEAVAICDELLAVLQ